MATLVTRYINTDTGSVDGNGSAESPYNSFATAISKLAAEYAGSLVSANVAVELHASGEADDPTSLNNPATLVMSADCDLTVIGDGTYRIHPQDVTRILNVTSTLNLNFLTFRNVRFKITATSLNDGRWLSYGWGGGQFRWHFDRCIFDGTGLNPARTGWVVINNGSGASGSIVINRCLIYGLGAPDAIAISGADSTTDVRNTTVVIAGTGYRKSGNGQLITRNCLYAGSGTGWVGAAHASSDYNASTDDTAPGEHSRQNQSVSFVEAASHNYRLAPHDTAARDQGTDLSGLTLPPIVDLDGKVVSGAWDIGAYESSETVAADRLVIASQPNEGTDLVVGQSFAVVVQAIAGEGGAVQEDLNTGTVELVLVDPDADPEQNGSPEFWHRTAPVVNGVAMLNPIPRALAYGVQFQATYKDGGPSLQDSAPSRSFNVVLPPSSGRVIVIDD